MRGNADAYVTGSTGSPNFPLVSPYQPVLAGYNDIFVSRITDTTPVHEESRTITYDYDPLYRLTAADYDDGTYFHYTYDPVGNRLTETTLAGATTYVYDDANRLTSVGGVPYSWSDNGNLLGDGATTYTYDHANRLVTAVQPMAIYVFSYNGLGDRLQQAVGGPPTNYTLDLVGGLTQVLSDGTNAYLYGNARIGEEQPAGWQYHLGDPLGSLRQLADPGVSITLSRAYEPFGDPLLTTGSGSSIYAFTGEQRDGTGLVYLRARYYGPAYGRFLTRDVWEGDPNQPMSYNAWLYVLAGPVTRTDPAGFWYCSGDSRCGQWISDALGVLRSMSWRATVLMEDFDRYDSELQANQYRWVWSLPWSASPTAWPARSSLECQVSGFHFIVTPDVPGETKEGGEWGMVTRPWAIYILDNMTEQPPDDYDAAVLAHEFVHLLWQGLRSITVQGELEAAQFQYQLLYERGHALPEFDGRTILELDSRSDDDLRLYRDRTPYGNLLLRLP